MSVFLTKYLGTHKFQNITSEFDTMNFRLINAPTTNNSNTSVLARNSVSGDIELVSKATITGSITMVNNSVAPGNIPILTNPGSNVAFPGPFSFRSLIPGSNVSFGVSTNEITINATSSSGFIEVNNISGLAIVTTTGTIALPGPLNFRGLAAGTGIGLSLAGPTITITNTAPSSGSLNIYNTDGSLINHRTVDYNNFDLTFNGTGSSATNFIQMDNFQVRMTSGVTTFNMTNSTIALNSSLSISLTTLAVSIDSGSVTIAPNGSQVYIGRVGGFNEIRLISPILRLMDIPAATNTRYVLQINPGLGARQVTYLETPSVFGVLNYVGQTTQVFTNINPTFVTGVTGTVSALSSSSIVLSGTGDGITYTGSGILKGELTFVGNMVVNTGANQDITITIFNGSTELSSARIVVNIGSTSGNICVCTRPIIVQIGAGINLRVGFARSGTNTSITFTGTMSIKNYVLE